MEVIVSHGGAGFDGLAALVACSKLQPQAAPVLVGPQSSALRKFLKEYSRHLPLKGPEFFAQQPIAKLHLLTSGEPLTELATKAAAVVTYDCSSSGQAVGALTTLMVGQLQTQALAVSAFEASLFLLGIYTATQGFTAPDVTPRDLAAAAWASEREGRLSALAHYLETPFAPGQQQLLNALLSDVCLENINGRSILVATAGMASLGGGLNRLIEELAELGGADIVIGIFHLPGQVHLLARSRRRELNVARLLAPLGVKGQSRLAALTTGELAPETLKTKALALLRQRLPRAVTAGDVMSTPVRTLAETASIAEANSLLLRYGHGGIPISGDGQRLSGMLSRRDVDKAMRHGLSQGLVRDYMSRNVVAVDALLPIEDVARVFVHNDIGRAPVEVGGRLAGIITRSDLLRGLHRGIKTIGLHPQFGDEDYRLAKPGPNVAALIRSRLSQRVQGLLMLLGQIGLQQGFQVYAVGGFVRDLLLHLPTTDLDVAVEGDALEFAQKTVAVAGGSLAVHPDLGTATLTLADGYRIDLATARLEYYRFPAAKPEVEQTTIKHDLYRRDFTINTMAVALNADKFGDFLDFFGGYSDLRAGLIRVLYNLSFVEDPTRIIRAIRFAGRYGFRLEAGTQALLARAVDDEMLAKAGPGLAKEVRLLFRAENVPALLRLAAEWAVLPKLFSGLEWNEELAGQLAVAARFSARQIGRGWLIYPLLVLAASQGVGLPAQLGLTDKEGEAVLQIRAALAPLAAAIKEGDSAVALYDALQAQPELASYALLAYYWRDTALHAKVLFYLEQLAGLKIAVGGKDLIKLGVKPGPEIGRLLRAVHRAKLQNPELTPAEQLALAERLHREGE